MLEFSVTDVVFQMADVTVAFIQQYDQTGSGLVVQFIDGGEKRIVRAPLDTLNAVQLCAFNFTSLCKKIEHQQMQILELKKRLEKDESQERAEVLPFKPRET